jgi:D-amino-acid dehydrogenase
MITKNAWLLSSDDDITSYAGHVVMIGAGIVNLMTAWRLKCASYDVDVYDGGPGPAPDPSWADQGCTLAGDNARMFTLTEADVYHDECAAVSGTGESLLDLAISRGGWRIFPETAWSSAERLWADEFRRVGQALSERYESDLLAFNAESGRYWEECISSEPAVFADSNLTRGILRLYTDRDAFEGAVTRHRRIGAVSEVMDAGQIASRYPSLAGQCAHGEIAGGMSVVGFTVGIHDFVRNLVIRLQKAGTRFHWRQQFSGIDWADKDQLVARGMRSKDGELVQADHLVLSPGAYGKQLLAGTRAADEIPGVLGSWISFLNVEPMMRHLMKIRQGNHVTPDTNVTVVNDPHMGQLLILGAGYGWTGSNPRNIDEAELEILFRGLEDTARKFFPAAYRMASGEGTLTASRRRCVRPWTASNLGIFECLDIAGGGKLIVTGGHNTGGLAQAPAVATAVLAAIRGVAHPMHACYEPWRLKQDLARL